MEGVEGIRSNDLQDYKVWLEALYISNGVERLLSLFLRHFTRGDGLPVEGGVGDENVALLFIDKFVSVHMRWIPAQSGSNGPMSTAPFESLILPFSGGSIHYTRYVVAGADDLDVFSRAAVATPVASGECKIGEILEVKSGRHCLVMQPSHEGVFSLQISSRISHRLTWDFDVKSGRAVSIRSASTDATRDQLSCKALEAMVARDSIATLQRVAREHDFHFVRMQAIRALHGLGCKELHVLLRERALNDPHVHVRLACEKNLMRMGEW